MRCDAVRRLEAGWREAGGTSGRAGQAGGRGVGPAIPDETAPRNLVVKGGKGGEGGSGASLPSFANN